MVRPAGSVASWEGESAPPPPDSQLVYTVLSRPLPDYAIEHTCRQCGPVEWVQLQQVGCSFAPGVYIDSAMLASRRSSSRQDIVGCHAAGSAEESATGTCPEEGAAAQRPHVCLGHRDFGSDGNLAWSVAKYSDH